METSLQAGSDSCDDAYSEAAFKTLKYAPIFPGACGSLADARGFAEEFFGYCNHESRHQPISSAEAGE